MNMVDVGAIKQDFPIFQREVNGKRLIYLDSASTSQKPKQVIEAVSNFYRNCNANIHRGIYTISEEATAAFEETRGKVAKFINANDASEIVFTHNTTEALNLVAYGLGQRLKRGDAILISEMEHHSNIVPWQRIAKEKGAKLYFLAIDDNGTLTNIISDRYDTRKYRRIAEIPNLKVVSITHVSNVLGTINPIEKIVKQLHPRGVPQAGRQTSLPRSTVAQHHLVRRPIVIIDGAQSVPHMPVDVQKLGCDFLAFSGHKMLAPTGVGVLWGRKKLLEEMEPLLIGSHMISKVTKEKAIWNDLPWKFEPGTAAIEAVVGLGAAVDYLNKVGMDAIRNHELGIMNYTLERLNKIDNLTVYGPSFAKASAGKPKDIDSRGGVISFNIDGVHSHDVAQILDGEGICIRSGHHCAMPLHQRLEITASCRASFYLYNDESDVNSLVEGIKKVKKIFKV